MKFFKACFLALLLFPIAGFSKQKITYYGPYCSFYLTGVVKSIKPDQFPKNKNERSLTLYLKLSEPITLQTLPKSKQRLNIPCSGYFSNLQSLPIPQTFHSYEPLNNIKDIDIKILSKVALKYLKNGKRVSLSGELYPVKISGKTKIIIEAYGVNGEDVSHGFVFYYLDRVLTNTIGKLDK